MAASDGLLAYYLMEEATGATRDEETGTSALDLLDSAAADVTQVSDSKFGTFSAGFDGANNSVLSIPDANLPATWLGESGCLAYTVGGLFKINAIGNLDMLFTRDNTLQMRLDTAPNQEIQLWQQTSAAAWESVFMGSNISIDTWYYVVARWQGDTDDELSLWIDGVKQSTTATVTALFEPGTDFRVGSLLAAGGNELNGHCDEFWTFDRALTDAEILEINNIGIVSFLGLIVSVDGLTATVTPGDITISRGLGNVDKRGLILAAVEDALDTISNSNGYNFTYQKHHRRSMEWDQVPGSMPAILWFPGETQYEALGGVGGGRMARMRITILGYYKRNNPDSDDFSSRVLKDIERALLRAQNNPGDTHYLANAGVEWLEWVGTEVDPYYQAEFRMGRVMVDVILNYTEKGSEIIAASTVSKF